uniref:Uncharacterized protein n=1 Tax=Dulem virus 42 TaxID=3145760 RepID=A0AAU8B7N7_9CAUD
MSLEDKENSGNIYKGSETLSSHVPKTISIGLDDVDQFSQEIIAKIETLSNGKSDSGISISFSTNTFDNKFNIPQSYIDNAIEDAVRDKIESENITEQAEKDRIRDEYNNDKKLLKEIKIQYMSEIVNKILSQVNDITNIKLIMTSLAHGKSFLPFAVANIHGHSIYEYNAHARIYRNIDMTTRKNGSVDFNKNRATKYLEKQLRNAFKQSITEADEMHKNDVLQE